MPVRNLFVLISFILTIGCSAKSGEASHEVTPAPQPAAKAEVVVPNPGYGTLTPAQVPGNDLTAADQSGTPADIEITAQIRRSIIGDKAMSFAAHNCKIITISGVTTLKGDVNTEAERAAIGAKAAATVGVLRVDNLLEVKAG